MFNNNQNRNCKFNLYHSYTIVIFCIVWLNLFLKKRTEKIKNVLNFSNYPTNFSNSLLSNLHYT